jgi:2-(1,2-epoxy-1,2-dihydrophenyl)acetyl-CoA isomerase
MLKISDDAGVRTLTLDRPDKLNALTMRLMEQLHHALVDCARDPGVRAVVLTGAGRGFCVGFDFGSGDDAQDDVTQRWRSEPLWLSPDQIAGRMMQDAQVPLLLHRMGKPTIAAIRGPAAGSGLVLAAACDLRIVSETAVLKTAFATAGRCGDPGASYLLTKLLGPAKAREIFLLDPRITATEALAMGLVTKVVPDDQLEAETRALATRFAEGPSMAYAGIKRNLNAAETATLEETMAVEGPTNAAASMSHDGKEAARAFMEKRKPVFRGY